MQKAHDSSYNDYWRNKPNITTPIVQDQLNRIETTIDTIDDRVVTFDTTKANQTDLLADIKNVSFDSSTGTFTFTKQNNTTIVIDTDIEKIAVNFDYDDDPESAHYQNLIITLDDGTVKYVDMSALITEYEFTDSSVIHFTINSGSVSASIINGSITEEKLQPNFLADCRAAKTAAETAETNAETAETNAQGYKRESEAWAVGTKDGVPVPPSADQYNNNAQYWAAQARAIVGDKVESFNGRTGTVVAQDGDYESGMIVPASAQVGQVPVVRNVGTGQDVKLRYVNEDYQSGILPHVIVISDTGSTVSAVKGGTTIYATETSTEHFEMDLPEFGTWTIHSLLGGDDSTVSLVVDTVKIYTVDDSHYHADITVTYPTGGTCSCSKSGETTLYATGSPYTFVVHTAGTWTITATANGKTFTEDVEITASGQTETLTLPEGSTVTPTDDVPTLIACAGIGNSEITTVSGLLADTTTLLAVINSNNAIDYLVRSTTFASDVTADSTAMSYIGLNNYAANTLLADSDWLTAICNSTYFESVLNVKVPVMTSNTTPSGVASANVSYDSYYSAYKAFDGNDNSTWFSTDTSSAAWVKYEFPQATKCYYARIKPSLMSDNSCMVKAYVLQGSNDDFTSDIQQLYTETLPNQNQDVYRVLNNINAYKYYRIYITSSYSSSTNRKGLYTLQFYGREDV